MAFQYDPFSQSNQEEKDSAVKKAINTGTNVAKNKIKRKIAKKAMKLAIKALKKGVVVLGKALIALLSSVGLPALLIGVGIILLILIITFVSSSLFGSGEGLNSEQQDLYNHIVAASNSTVDLNKPEQAPYKVPVQLLSSIVQLDAMKDDDHYQIISDMANILAPNFTYSDNFNEWTETQTRVCKEGEGCEPWSDIERVDNWVSKLVNVEYWQGEVEIGYIPYITDWKTTVEVETVIEKEKRTVTEEYTDYETRYETVYEEVPYKVTEWQDREVKNIVKEYQKVPHPPWTIVVEKEVTSIIQVPVVVTKYKTVPKEVTKEVPVKKQREVEIEVEVEKEIRTYTRTRHQRYTKHENKREDYTHLDTALNSLGFGINDKRLLEANYGFQGLPINYIGWLEGRGGSGGNFGGVVPYPGTIVPGSDIPSQYMPYYLSAEAKYGVHWYTLAALHSIETVFSTMDPMISPVGAEGHMQFMPCTWVGWAYPGCAGTNGNAYIPDNIKNNPSKIKQYGGFGVDANGDGTASPWDLEDAIHAAAKMLAANGYAKDPRSSIFVYNRAGWYVDEVLARAERYRDEAVYRPNDNQIATVLDAAQYWLGKPNQYVFGGGRNPSDIANGRFDCSSFVHWAFAQAGIDLGPVTSVSTETLNKMGRRVSFSEIKPGDIIFFDTYKSDGHVGIWLGNGKWIGTQGSTGIAIVNQNTNSYWQSVFSGHVRRIL